MTNLCNLLTKIGSISISILFVLVFFVPSVFIPAKVILLLICIFCLIVAVLTKRVRINKATFISGLIFSIIGLAYSFYGVLNDNPGAVSVITIKFLWPLLFTFLSSYINQSDSFYKLEKIFIISIIFIVVYGYLFIGYHTGVIPSWMYIELDKNPGYGFYDGKFEFRLGSLASLIFLIPFLIHLIIVKFNHSIVNYRLILLLVISLFLILLSGRRALMFVILLTPILIVISSNALNNKKIGLNICSLIFSLKFNLLVFVLILSMTYILASVDFNYEQFVNEVFNAFDSREDGAESERITQLYSLLDGWYKSNIFFGEGNGAVTSVVRSEGSPWAYELTYIYYLFSTGLFGVLFLSTWFIYGVYRLRRGLILQPKYSIYIGPILTGVFAFLVAAMTNPYMEKFDYIWVIMFPHLIASGLSYQKNKT